MSTPTTFTPPASPPTGAPATLQIDGTTGLSSANTPTGAHLTLQATGFDPGSTVTFVAYSTPTTLGTATADHTGTARLTLTLPDTLHAGTHALVAYGTDPHGTAHTPTATLTLTADTTTNLAATGADTTLLLPLALALLTLGGTLTFTTRRGGRTAR